MMPVIVTNASKGGEVTLSQRRNLTRQSSKEDTSKSKTSDIVPLEFAIFFSSDIAF